MSPRLFPALAALWLLPLLAAATVVPPVTPAPHVAAVPEPAPPPPPPPRVMLVTTQGEIVLELDAAAAPKSVENFLSYARDGHYNGTVFHRVVPGLLMQAGAFTPDLQQKPTRPPVPSEADNGLANRRGTVAAAHDRGDVDSATSQFFINLGDNPAFDRKGGDAGTGGYTVFGRVVLGMDVVERIAAQPTSAQGPFTGWVPTVPVVIERVQMVDAPAPTPAIDPAAPPAPPPTPEPRP